MRTTCQRITGVIALSIIVLIATVPAFAADGISNIKFVDVDEGTSPINPATFSYSSGTPWIFIQTTGATTPVSLKWYLNYNMPGEVLLGETPLPIPIDPSFTKKLWLKLPDTNWDSGHTGEWTIWAQQGTGGTGTATLTLTPEPMSSVLFLLGGALILTRARRKFVKK